MEIEVLGVGCPKCTRMYEAVVSAVELAGLQAQVRKVYDLDELTRRGVVAFPALVVDGEVRSVGKLLDPGAIVRLLRPRPGGS